MLRVRYRPTVRTDHVRPLELAARAGNAGQLNATYVHKTRGVQCVVHARLNDAPRMLSCCAFASDPRRASYSAARPRKTKHDVRAP